ncbi:DUF3108 domain-containing protein [Alkalilimnicola ehrlichii MLHE-1]|uniref:DUF3108 domain-containing protein n=1 Tax=Alkalilimnicola ehrlichii (strain ATCC BAA-1101 / DSM 17681 / MLHE-1) TaxID=187272 RepID=Q0ABB9_ALKEH|nr:DUF3108 domain-containing protein [Alkalilimnicola ehrlichii]ABI55868.1 conserved hypothetical protein [Alkalilimnicola ehrlichii MLHE-1]
MRRVLLAIGLGLALSPWHAGLAGEQAATGELPPFAAQYRVHMGAFTVGEGWFRFERPEADRYRFEVATRPRGIIRMAYRDETKEVSEGTINGDQFRPERYHYQRSGRRNEQETLLFDWAAGKARDKAGDWEVDLSDGVKDRVVTTMALMQDLARGRTGDRTYRVADDGDIDEYQFRLTGEETVETPVGTYETIRYVRVREGSSRETRVWSAPELHYLPVRVEHVESDGTTFRMTLDRLEGMEPM